MKPATLIQKIKVELLDSHTQVEALEILGICIRRMNGIYHLASDTPELLKSFYDDVVMLGYKYHTIIECPNNEWAIFKKGSFYYQAINIEDEV